MTNFRWNRIVSAARAQAFPRSYRRCPRVVASELVRTPAGSAVTACSSCAAFALALACSSEPSPSEPTQSNAEQTGVKSAAIVDESFGTWSFTSQATAQYMHVGLTRPGYVLAVGGSQANCGYTWGYQSASVYYPWGNWTDLGGTNRPYPFHAQSCDTNGDPQNPGAGHIADAFCSGHAHDGQGRWIILGGLKGFKDCNSLGVPFSSRYDPATATFTVLGQTPALYYPTLVTSATGKVVAFAGNQADASLAGKVYQQEGTGWATLPAMHNTMDTYPRVHLLPSGVFFVSSPQKDNQKSYYYHFWAEPATTNPVPEPGGSNIYQAFYGSSVLMPLDPNGQGGYFPPWVLITNGSTAHWTYANYPNLGTWQETPARPTETAGERRSATAILLPTGQVFVHGGPQLRAEVFGRDIGSWGFYYNEWFATEPSQIARQYHSVALLLPDGRVWTAGGNNNAGGSDCVAGGWTFEDDGNPGNPYRRVLETEIFTPWYAKPGVARPVISSCPTNMYSHGANYTINLSSGDGQQIAKVALMRPGSMTHAFDSGQRLVWLEIVGTPTASTVTVKSPYSAAAAPPGDYMIFVLKRGAGVTDPHIPSKACWTRR